MIQKNIIKSSGGIVMHPKTGKILVTIKIDDTKRRNLRKYTDKELIELLGAQFTKGRVDEGEDILIAAKREIQEEGGVREHNLKLLGELGLLYKERKGIIKEIIMYLFTLFHEQKEYMPTDYSHKSSFLDIEKVQDILKSQEEKIFLQEHKYMLDSRKKMLLEQNNFAKQQENYK